MAHRLTHLEIPIFDSVPCDDRSEGVRMRPVRKQSDCPLHPAVHVPVDLGHVGRDAEVGAEEQVDASGVGRSRERVLYLRDYD